MDEETNRLMLIYALWFAKGSSCQQQKVKISQHMHGQQAWKQKEPMRRDEKQGVYIHKGEQVRVIRWK